MDFFTLTNRIKNDYNTNWLTPSQELIFDSIKNKYKSQSMINIYGSSGAGKTFLAWVIEKELGVKYVKNVDEFENGRTHIIDDYPHNRNDIRKLFQEAFFKDVEKIIVITEKPADDDITKLHLDLTEADKAKFKNNLWMNFQFKIKNEKQNYDLNSLIKNNIS